MAALLDTHSFLWLASDESHLSAAALHYLRDAANPLLLSTASQWEIAIKFGKGRRELDVPLREMLVDVPQRLSIDILPITADHLLAVASLPEHHRDSLDRLLAA